MMADSVEGSRGKKFESIEEKPLSFSERLSLATLSFSFAFPFHGERYDSTRSLLGEERADFGSR